MNKVNVLDITLNNENRYIVFSKILTNLHRMKYKYNYALAFPRMLLGNKKIRSTLGNKIQIFFENSELIDYLKEKNILSLVKTYEIKEIDLSQFKGKTGIIYKKKNNIKKTSPSYIRNTLKKVLFEDKKIPFGEKVLKKVKKILQEEDISKIKNYLLNKDTMTDVSEIVSYMLKEDFFRHSYNPYIIHESLSLQRKNANSTTAILEISKSKGIFNKFDFNNFNSFGLAKNDEAVIPLI